MVTVNSNAEMAIALTAQETVITLGAASLLVDTLPTWICTIIMPEGTGIIGAKVTSCTTGSGSLLFNPVE